MLRRFARARGTPRPAEATSSYLRRARQMLGLACIGLALAGPARAEPLPVLTLPGAAQAPAAPRTGRDQRGSAAIEARFLSGLGALTAGRPEAAIPLFLGILADDPTLVRVRLELARAYFEAGQWSRARQEFFTVLSTDLPEPVRQRVLQFIRAIDARRGLDWDLSIGLTTLGDLRDYDSDRVELDFGAGPLPFTLERDSGSALGLQLRGDVTYRRALDRGVGAAMDTVAFAGLEVDLMDGPGSEFDDLTVGARAGLRFLGAQRSVVASAFGQTRQVAGRAFEDRYGAEVSFEWRDRRGLSLFGAASFAQIDNAVSDDRDGQAASGLLGVRRALAGRGSIGTLLRVEENRVAFDLEDYRDTEWRVFGSYDAAWGLTFAPALSLRHRAFRDPSPLFVQSPDERIIELDLTVQKRDLFLGDGFSPFARVRYARARSDIEAYSYTETEVQIGVERRF